MDTKALHKEFEHFRNTHPVRKFKQGDAEGEYIFCGTGTETILLLHGFAGNTESPYKFILAFENEYRIICPTIPALKPATAAAALVYIETILKLENLCPEIVIGGSFGGIVAQAYWYANRETVKKVTLFDTAPPDKAAGIKNRKGASVIKHLPWIIFKPLLGMKLKKLFRISRDMKPSTKNLVHFSKQNFERRLQTVSKELLFGHSDIAFDFMINAAVPPLNKEDTQLLIIHSTDDPATKGADVEFKRIYPFAQIIPFTGAGHIGSIIYFKEYITAIRDMMRRRQ